MALPIQSTRFIGREQELAEIASLLNDPTCRLLTLVGAGGSGKTRLALEIAQQLDDHFDNGAYFVPLQSIGSRDMFISSIIEVMNHSLYGQEDPDTQLLNFLRDKQTLLILDNFEHLLDLSSLITAMLEEAVNVTLLVTSRETLNLREEWLFPVSGMGYPENDSEILTDFSAVQLFLEHAHRIRRDFAIEQEQKYVIQICRAVEGMPLGIELAASWLRVLPCEEIVAEIQHSLDFLETNLRNIPERHRSMRAVFEQSWKLLNETERDVFKRLSVFGGSFGREAAADIAEASLTALSALVDKSLLKTTPNGRYQIHELLRQFGQQKLQEVPEEVTLINARHCDFFTTFAHEIYSKIFSSRQRETLQAIGVEIENIRAAWQYAVHTMQLPNIEQLAHTYYAYCDLQSRYRESIDSIEQVLSSLRQQPESKDLSLLIALLLAYLGYDYIRVGRYDDSNTVFIQSVHYLQQHASPPLSGFGSDPLAGLSLLHTTIGNYREAIQYGEKSRQQTEAANDDLNLQVAFYALASATFSQGDYDKASAYVQQALAITRAQDHHWMTAYVLTVLGNIARAQGDYEQARQHYLESYSLKEALDDPEGMAAALNQLGEIALRQQDYEEANRLYQRSLDTYHEIYDRGGLATAQKGTANAAIGMNDEKTAYENFSQALQTAADIQYMPLILAILADIGEIMLPTDRREHAIELLTLAHRHNASEHETREQAGNTLRNAGIPLNEANSDLLELTATELRPLIDSTQTGLNSLEQLLPARTRVRPDRAQQDLIDPLSKRELEILHLLAQGLTNQGIANELILVVGTVKAHNHNIFSKLGVHNRVQAITRARELGLVE